MIVFKSDCHGSGNLKFAYMLVARLMVLQRLGYRSFLGVLFLMTGPLAYVTFWFCCCHMSSEKNCLNKNRLWRGGNMYIHCACLFGDKKMLQRQVWAGVGSVQNLCLFCKRVQKHAFERKLLLFFSPQIPQMYIPFFMMLKGDLILSSFQKGMGFFCCIMSTEP